MKDEISYTAAIAEIEAILNRLGSEACDVDALAAQVARADELISLCRKRLRAAQEDTEQALKESRE